MPAAENEQIMAPGAVIPFTVDNAKASSCFVDHIRKKRFVPKAVQQCKLDNFVGLYLPFWTYDMVVYASDKVKHPHISKVQNFYFDRLVPYKPEYLAGFAAERYTVGLNDGWERAKVQIAKKLKSEIGEYERKRNRGDTCKEVQLSTDYYNVKFKYMLAPMYLATYTYGNRTYQVAINGQTGAVYCDAPNYIWKIILFILLGIFALPFTWGLLSLLLSALFGGFF